MKNKLTKGLLTLSFAVASSQLYAEKGSLEVRVDSSTYTNWGTDLVGPVSGTTAQGITWGHNQVLRNSSCKTYIDYIKNNQLYSRASLRLTGAYGFVTNRSGTPWVKFGFLTKCELILAQ